MLQTLLCGVRSHGGRTDMSVMSGNNADYKAEVVALAATVSVLSLICSVLTIILMWLLWLSLLLFVTGVVVAVAAVAQVTIAVAVFSLLKLVLTLAGVVVIELLLWETLFVSLSISGGRLCLQCVEVLPLSSLLLFDVLLFRELLTLSSVVLFEFLVWL